MDRKTKTTSTSRKRKRPDSLEHGQLGLRAPSSNSLFTDFTKLYSSLVGGFDWDEFLTDPYTSEEEHQKESQVANAFLTDPYTSEEELQKESQVATEHLRQEDEARMSLDGDFEDSEERRLHNGKDDSYAAEDGIQPSSALETLLLKLIDLDLTNEVHVGKLVRIIRGGCADIHVWVLADGKCVAEKRIRFYTEDDQHKVEKRVARELRIWFKLRHPNVLPLKGYIRREHHLFPSIITEWMENGSLQHFLKNNREVNDIKMVVGMTDGLSYLHNEGVVHGDLKAANVVVSQDGVPMLMDFGISHLLMATTVAETATSAQNGSLRWAAPELIFPEEPGGEDDIIVHTKESDIWALGMTYLEVLTKNFPYAHLSSDASIMGSLFQKRIPRTPDDWHSWPETKKRIWELCLRCWSISVLERPSAAQLAHELEQLGPDEQQTRRILRSEEEWRRAIYLPNV